MSLLRHFLSRHGTRRLPSFQCRMFSTKDSHKLSDHSRAAINPNDVENFDFLTSSILPKVRQFIAENADEDVPICNYKTFEELQKLMAPYTGDGSFELPQQPVSDDQLLNEIDLLLKYSPRSGKARYADKLYSGSDAITQCASYLMQVINNNSHTYNSSQVLTIVEQATIRSLCKVFFGANAPSTSGGVFLPGGAYSNTLAFRLARDRYFPSITTDGVSSGGGGGPIPTVLVSDQSHYSASTAATHLGIGSNNVRKLQTNDNGTINLEQCVATIEQLLAENRKPFVLSCNSGTTVFGAFDDFSELAKVCAQYDIWFHVDGCWGGAAAFAVDSNAQCASLMRGVEQADSIAFDAHKLLSSGLLCGCLMVKDESYLYRSCEPPNAKYLFHGGDEDIGLKTLQCGRQCDALKLYLSWLYYGKQGLVQRVENALHNAHYLCREIEASEDFMLVQTPPFCNVCFWYFGNVDDAMKKKIRAWKTNGYQGGDDEMFKVLEMNTQRIYAELKRQSSSISDYSPAKGLPSFLRTITSNYRLTTPHMDVLWADIRNAAHSL
mmetsp:Transcript_10117/g.15339  ORF Transcript_10117/g.15339 Transcript_10117/m.15339 type:complete len:551 (-) Transcript_10117:113-1765(-)